MVLPACVPFGVERDVESSRGLRTALQVCDTSPGLQDTQRRRALQRGQPVEAACMSEHSLQAHAHSRTCTKNGPSEVGSDIVV